VNSALSPGSTISAAGNRNNWRDGFYSREMKAERKWISGLIRQCLQTLREFDGL
jgi:hypothetical protein